MINILMIDVYATPDFNYEPINIYEDCIYWDKIELLRDSNNNLKQEKFIKDNEHKAEEIIKAFNNNRTPNSQYFLLHYAPGWNTGIKENPVILIHGAGKNGNFFIDPLENGATQGLAQYLVKKGYKVFAITFAHPHGDNYYQSEILSDAIEKIKSVTNSSKVDIIAHSKGNMSARMYLSNIKKNWGTEYRGDVRRYIQLGAPNGGIDFTFRNPNMAWSLIATGGYGPVPYTKMLVYGLWQDTVYHSIYSEGGAYPGQSQMLARWDGIYPLNIYQQDWYTTYHGGLGFASYSYGINYAINQGGDLIDTLRNSPISSGIEIAILAGNKNIINGIPWEITGPSDGLVFVKSATDTSSMEVAGANVIANDVYYLNHLELAYSKLAMEWVDYQLSR
ncbi:MAG: acetyltransferase [Deferribacterales bacterium]|nr:acetyltransferase [Deferribacterales bacterium]